MRHSSGSSSDNSTNGSINSNLSLNHQNDLYAVAIKSHIKPKSRSIQRQTKRPPSERRFKCDQCERMFFTRKDVKRHLVVHTGIRNFACPFCTQRFGRKDHLVRHAKKSHNKDTRSSATKTTSETLPLNNKAANNLTSMVLSSKSSQTIDAGFETKSCVSYANNNQTENHSIILTNSTDTANYLNSHSFNSPITSLSASNDSFIVHNLDDKTTTSNNKSEITPHYFAFPVNPSSSVYHHTAFLPGCFVPNNATVNYGSSTTATTFGLPVSVCSDASINATLSVDMTSSLPHFNQAFQ